MRVSTPLIFVAAIVFSAVFCKPAYAESAAQLYAQASVAAKRGEHEGAFMYLRSLISEYPHSRYAERAFFAIGEYYFLVGDYRDAVDAFRRVVNEYSDIRIRPFALAYLRNIAQQEHLSQDMVRELEKEIISLRQVSLLFRDSKEYRYRSALFQRHSVIYYIDRVEFYINGELFAKIIYS